MFLGFHSNGIINQNTKATFIVLVPKKSQTTKILDFRPINLVTSLYKIIAKVLLGRLRKVLNETIFFYFLSQGAFIEMRQILEVVLITNEVVDEKGGWVRKGWSSKLTLKRTMTMWIGVFWIMYLKGKVLAQNGDLDLGDACPQRVLQF